MLTQSADTADDERNILIGAPNRPPMIAPKAGDGCYGLASALGHKPTFGTVGPRSALPPEADGTVASCWGPLRATTGLVTSPASACSFGQPRFPETLNQQLPARFREPGSPGDP